MTAEASLVGVVRTILIIVAIYWGFRLFSRYVLPWLLARLMLFIGKKAEEQMRARGFDTGGFSNSYEEKVADDGKVSIKKTKGRKSKNPNLDDVGEYVDFEEVE